MYVRASHADSVPTWLVEMSPLRQHEATALSALSREAKLAMMSFLPDLVLNVVFGLFYYLLRPKLFSVTL